MSEEGRLAVFLRLTDTTLIMLLLSLLGLVVAHLHAGSVGAHAVLTTKSDGVVGKTSDDPSTQPVVDMLTRVLGATAAAQFDLTIIDASQCTRSTSTGDAVGDCFQIADATGEMVRDGKSISIGGSTLSALTTGCGVYLKRFANASLTWGDTGGLLRGTIGETKINRHGRTELVQLPKVGRPITAEPITATRAVKWTYYMNVVDFSYSFVWWNWDRWQQEIDWMALHGVNLALAYTGQEEVYRQLYEAHGLTAEDMGEFFGGPAYLAWSRGQGLAGLGGPLPQWWYRQQADLNVKILAGMKQLGITAILPGFQGNVPKKLRTIYPKANISSSGWLDALDPLFATLADDYMQKLLATFETTHYYEADGLFSASKAPWYSGEESLAMQDGNSWHEDVDTDDTPKCVFSKAAPDRFLFGCSKNCEKHDAVESAQAACAAEPTCGGITSGYNGAGRFQLRSGNNLQVSPHNETSYVVCQPNNICISLQSWQFRNKCGFNMYDRCPSFCFCVCDLSIYLFLFLCGLFADT